MTEGKTKRKAASGALSAVSRRRRSERIKVGIQRRPQGADEAGERGGRHAAEGLPKARAQAVWAARALEAAQALLPPADPGRSRREGAPSEQGRPLLDLADPAVRAARLQAMGLGDGTSEHGRRVDRILEQLATQPALREKLRAIPAPRSEPMRAIVRSTLHLPPTAAVTAEDAQRAVLAAWLSDLRQGSVGSCFGTSVAIVAHATRPERFLKDMADLMADGALVSRVHEDARTGGNTPVAPLVGRTPVSEARDDQDLREPVRGGPVSQVVERLLATEGFEQVAASLAPPGITRAGLVEQLRRHVGRVADRDRDGKVTAGAVLDALAQASGANEAALQRAKADFVDRQHNRLLRAWEYTITASAESLSSSRRLDQLRRPVLQALNGALSNSNLSREVQSAAGGAVREAMQRGLRYRYDPGVTEEGSRSRGGWRLVELDPKDPLAPGRPLNSKAALQSLISRMVTDAVRDAVLQTEPKARTTFLRRPKLTDEQERSVVGIAHAVSEAVHDNQTTDRWRIRSGGYSQETVEAWSGRRFVMDTQDVDGTAGLAGWVVGRARAMRDTLPAAAVAEPYAAIMTRRHHAFVFRPFRGRFGEVVAREGGAEAVEALLPTWGDRPTTPSGVRRALAGIVEDFLARPRSGDAPTAADAQALQRWFEAGVGTDGSTARAVREELDIFVATRRPENPLQEALARDVSDHVLKPQYNRRLAELAPPPLDRAAATRVLNRAAAALAAQSQGQALPVAPLADRADPIPPAALVSRLAEAIQAAGAPPTEAHRRAEALIQDAARGEAVVQFADTNWSVAGGSRVFYAFARSTQGDGLVLVRTNEDGQVLGVEDEPAGWRVMRQDLPELPFAPEAAADDALPAGRPEAPAPLPGAAPGVAPPSPRGAAADPLPVLPEPSTEPLSSAPEPLPSVPPPAPPSTPAAPAPEGTTAAAPPGLPPRPPFLR